MQYLRFCQLNEVHLELMFGFPLWYVIKIYHLKGLPESNATKELQTKERITR
jgi:hypothetical protein